MSSGDAERPRASFLDAFRDPKLALMLGVGFASGLPNPLSGTTLRTWMTQLNVDLTTIGLFSLVQLPYNLKPFWAPILDRYPLPFLSKRRGWAILMQVALIATLVLMGTINPRATPRTMALVALLVCSLSATQDIALDAYRTDVLGPAERASGTMLSVAAYRVAMIVAGAGALALADHIPWRTVYIVMAMFMGVGLITMLIAPEPEIANDPPAELWRVFWNPLVEFFTNRPRVLILVLVVILFKVGDAVAGSQRAPFLVLMGFSGTEIGTVLKGLGLGATIVGAFLGGGFIARFGLKPALIIFGASQALANFGYVVLSWYGHNLPIMAVAIAVDDLMNGLGTAAFVAFLMLLCNKRYSATQFALLSAMGSITGRLLSATSGWLAEEHGWASFFYITMALGLVSVVLLIWAPVREMEEAEVRQGTPS